MAEQKFAKGTDEWLMFMDYWNLCQKYWQVESADSYWDSLINATNEFYEKYKHIELAKKLALALCEAQEDKFKNRK